MSGFGSPMTPPPQVRCLYAGISPGPTGDVDVEWDHFYDLAGASVEPADAGAWLAAVGLTYDAGVFTATARMLLWVDVEVDAKAATGAGGDCSVTLSHPANDANPEVIIPATNTLGDVHLLKMFPMQAGDTFSVTQACNSGSDVPTTGLYVAMFRLA
jgi:hypothetical protein